MDLNQSPIKQDLSIAKKVIAGGISAVGAVLIINSLIKLFGEIGKPLTNSTIGIFGVGITCLGVSMVFRKFPSGAKTVAISIVLVFLITLGRHLIET